MSVLKVRLLKYAIISVHEHEYMDSNTKDQMLKFLSEFKDMPIYVLCMCVVGSVFSPASLGQVKSTLSPAQVDPFFTQGDALSSEDQLDETWITVFG